MGNYDEYSGKLVVLHQNLGIATAVLSVLTAGILHLTLIRKLTNRLLYRSMLCLTVVVLTWAGHLGAKLTHGEDYLSISLNEHVSQVDINTSSAFLNQLTDRDTISESLQEKLNLEVRQIFAHNCYQCHSENKQKGELILENKKGVDRGGKSGKIIVAGKPLESELFKRITLPPDHDKVMPKKGENIEVS